MAITVNKHELISSAYNNSRHI